MVLVNIDRYMLLITTIGIIDWITKKIYIYIFIN